MEGQANLDNMSFVESRMTVTALEDRVDRHLYLGYLSVALHINLVLLALNGVHWQAHLCYMCIVVKAVLMTPFGDLVNW